MSNHRLLKKSYEFVKSQIQGFNGRQTDGRKISFLESEGGFFLYVDFRAFIQDVDKVAGERRLFLDIIKKGEVYIAPGKIGFYQDEPGWFRLVFAQPTELLELAMSRIFKVLAEFKSSPWR